MKWYNLNYKATFKFHSLTLQSNEVVRNMCEKSIGPGTLWQLRPVTGP